MSLVQLLVVLLVLGLLLYGVTLIPLDNRIRGVIAAVLIVVACVWLLNASGLAVIGHSPRPVLVR